MLFMLSCRTPSCILLGEWVGRSFDVVLISRLNEIKAMADRLRSVRDKLFDVIANKLKTPGSWLHIKRATGMYW